jgi:hypothetical protein
MLRLSGLSAPKEAFWVLAIKRVLPKVRLARLISTAVKLLPQPPTTKLSWDAPLDELELLELLELLDELELLEELLLELLDELELLELLDEELELLEEEALLAALELLDELLLELLEELLELLDEDAPGSSDPPPQPANNAKTSGAATEKRKTDRRADMGIPPWRI